MKIRFKKTWFGEETEIEFDEKDIDMFQTKIDFKDQQELKGFIQRLKGEII